MASRASGSEFALIARHFAPLATHSGAFGLTDDAAIITPDPGTELVITTDMLIVGVHFFAGDDPALIAKKAIRVNLSDLAAMGAQPFGYSLGFGAPPDIDENWLEAFALGLRQDQEVFGISLLGGDTVASPLGLVLSITAYGSVPAGKGLRRMGAKVGDILCVSGTIGNAALGLLAKQGVVDDVGGDLQEHYHLPQPRVELGVLLRGVASAALDVSDGLFADLSHLCRESGVGAKIATNSVPLSASVKHLVDNDIELLETVLTGGDDYELLFAIPASEKLMLPEISRNAHVAITEIGVCTEDNHVNFADANGTSMLLKTKGYQHF